MYFAVPGTNPVQLMPAPAGTPISLNQVHVDNVPMAVPDGAFALFAWTLQPHGAIFEPRIRIEYPNMTALPPNSIAYFLSFDHDINRFSIVASGHVTSDGSTIVTDPGAGLRTAGWGCNCPPYVSTADCQNCVDTCVNNGSLSGGSVVVMPPMATVGDTATFIATGVVDSGGLKARECPLGGGSSMIISPGSVSYTYLLRKPSGLTISGSGASVSVFVDECGPYSCTFTAAVARECSPDAVAIVGSLMAGTNTVAAITAVNYIESVTAPTSSNFGEMRPVAWNVDIGAEFDCTMNKWRARLTRADSVYTIWWQLPSGISEANLGSASATNHCHIIANLMNLGYSSIQYPAAWYMLAAVEAHERVHVAEWQASLNAVFPALKSGLEGLCVPHTPGMTAIQAVSAIKALPEYQLTIDDVHDPVTQMGVADVLFFSIPDPNPQTNAAERAVVDPRISAIMQSAATNGWPICP